MYLQREIYFTRIKKTILIRGTVQNIFILHYFNIYKKKRTINSQVCWWTVSTYLIDSRITLQSLSSMGKFIHPSLPHLPTHSPHHLLPPNPPHLTKNLFTQRKRLIWFHEIVDTFLIYNLLNLNETYFQNFWYRLKIRLKFKYNFLYYH